MNSEGGKKQKWRLNEATIKHEAGQVDAGRGVETALVVLSLHPHDISDVVAPDALQQRLVLFFFSPRARAAPPRTSAN